MKRVHLIVSILVVVLGLLHVGVTFRDFDQLSMGAVWFAGSGVAIVLAGFLNIALLRDVGNDRVIRAMCIFTNVVFLLGFAGATFMLPQPQVYFGTLLFLIVAICSIV
jgi:hypothetical protein